MQDSREEGEKEERELAAAIRERMRESGAMDRISAGVRSGTESEIFIFKISIFPHIYYLRKIQLGQKKML